MSEDGGLHRLDPTRRFADRADDYARWRPRYPDGAVDAVIEGLSPNAVAADIGAGTGIFSRLLAGRGVGVLAVEPNAAMRAAARMERDAAGDIIRWIEGTAEATGLEAGSVDLVTCAQAFHWFYPPQALPEFWRVLKPRGRLALIWNQRDNGDPLTRGYIEAIRAVGGEHHPVEVLSERAFDPAVVEAGGLFARPVERRWPHAQGLSREGMVGRAMSASYTPKDAASRARLEGLLSDLFDKHRDADGLVYLRYSTVVYVAARRDRAQAPSDPS